jgi:hypothetical protein
MLGPTPPALLERVRNLCNREMIAIEMQSKRLKMHNITSAEERWADFQFLIIALSRFRRAAILAAKHYPSLGSGILAFDAALPDLAKMRNVAEHFDDYAEDNTNRRQKKTDGSLVDRGMLGVYTMGLKDIEWLGYSLNTSEAVEASANLLHHLKKLE